MNIGKQDQCSAREQQARVYCVANHSTTPASPEKNIRIEWGSNNLNLSSADGGSVLLSRSALRDISAGLVHTAMVATKVVTAADVTGAVGDGGALVVGVVLLHVAWPCA